MSDSPYDASSVPGMRRGFHSNASTLLREENAELARAHAEAESENTQLRADVTRCVKLMDELKQLLEGWQRKSEQMYEALVAAQSENVELRAQLTMLAGEIAEYENSCMARISAYQDHPRKTAADILREHGITGGDDE